MIRLAVRCRLEQAELVLAELTVLAPNGVEEERASDHVEYAIYGGPGELPDLGTVQAVAGEGLIDVEATEVPDDWADRWQDFHKPLLVGGRLWLRPSWEPRREGTVDVVVDPGRAFGTGAHPTTRLCLEMLLDLHPGGGLTDLGTGSGVLAIAAAKLGWAPVAGWDHEAAGLESAAANAVANEVRIELARVNLRDEVPPLAPTVVANLTAPLLLRVAERLAEPPGRLICSGLLASEADRVSGAFTAAGLAERRRRREGDWSALLLTVGDREIE